MSEITRKKHTGETGNAGEFGTHARNESDISLGGEQPEINKTFTARPSRESGLYTVGNDITHPPAVVENGWYTQRVIVGGAPHANAMRRAIAAQFSEEDRVPALIEALELLQQGEKMTVLSVRKGQAGVSIHEGTGSPDTGLLKCKGSSKKGWRIDNLGVVAVMKGYGHADELAAKYDYVANTVPTVSEATIDGIPSADGVDEPFEDIAAVYLVNGPDFGDGSTAGCLWLVTDTQEGGDIVNGYFWAPDGATSFSEHGSIRTADLQRSGGRVLDYKPGSLTFSNVMENALGGTCGSAYEVITR